MVRYVWLTSCVRKNRRERAYIELEECGWALFRACKELGDRAFKDLENGAGLGIFSLLAVARSFKSTHDAGAANT